jgi:hypothetical protein
LRVEDMAKRAGSGSRRETGTKGMAVHDHDPSTMMHG